MKAVTAIIQISGPHSTGTFAINSPARRAHGWALDGYSGAQIARELGEGASDVAEARGLLRSEGWA